MAYTPRTTSVSDDCVELLSTIIGHELLRSPISDAARSHGSMFVLELGELRECHSTETKPRSKRRGDWTLVAQFGEWEIITDVGLDANHESSHQQIEDCLREVIGKTITEFTILTNGDIRLLLNNGGSIAVRGQGMDTGDLWMLFRRSWWSLSFAIRNAFELEISGNV